MTQTTEDKALALYSAVSLERGLEAPIAMRREASSIFEALCRAIEQHEATKQEFSDAVEKAQTVREIHCQCSRKHVVSFDILNQFIIPKPKPDPLVEVMEKMGWYIAPNGPTDAENFRAALDALGFEIRGKG